MAQMGELVANLEKLDPEEREKVIQYLSEQNDVFQNIEEFNQ